MSASALPVLPEPTAETQPRHRSDCLPGGRNEARPCPWSCCRHSLTPEGAVGACALDVADRGGLTHDAIGQLLGGITRERVRQIEAAALRKIAKRAATKPAHAGYRELATLPPDPPHAIRSR